MELLTTTLATDSPAADGLDPFVVVWFTGVALLIGTVVVVVAAMRRRDRTRVVEIAKAHGLLPVPAEHAAELVERVGAGIDRTSTVDPLRLVGTTSVLTRRRTVAESEFDAVHVRPGLDTDPRPGVIAMMRSKTTATTTSAMSRRTTSTSGDVVVARLPRPIDGRIDLGAVSDAGIDPDHFGAAIERLAAAGMGGRTLSDRRINRSWMVDGDPRTTDRIIVHDRGLLDLLIAARIDSRDPSELAESSIPHFPVKELESLSIDGDLLVLTAAASPFQSGVRSELVALADHLTRHFPA